MKTYLLVMAAFLSPIARADWGGIGYGHMYSGGMFMGMGLFWIVLVALGVWLFSMLNSKRSVKMDEESAVNIVKRRYANGEISESEMKSMIENVK
jgi:uncharacterized membrane protein